MQGYEWERVGFTEEQWPRSEGKLEFGNTDWLRWLIGANDTDLQRIITWGNTKVREDRQREHIQNKSKETENEGDDEGDASE